MVWTPSHCHVCGSDKRRATSLCENQEYNGTPCHGLSAQDAALLAARIAFERDEITLLEYEARVEVALTDPPKRQFGSILVLR